MSDLPPAVPAGEDKAKEQFIHPETGEEISKNAWKKLQKPAKVKKGMPTPPAGGGAKAEKKAKKEKKVEEVAEDLTPVGEKKRIEDVFPTTYQPKHQLNTRMLSGKFLFMSPQ
jgi:hypothetical protein